jgi:hypothetical protein
MRLEPSILGRPLKEGTQAFRLPVQPTGSDPHVETDLTAVVRVTVRNRLPVLETLANLGNWVRGHRIRRP